MQPGERACRGRVGYRWCASRGASAGGRGPGPRGHRRSAPGPVGGRGAGVAAAAAVRSMAVGPGRPHASVTVGAAQQSGELVDMSGRARVGAYILDADKVGLADQRGMRWLCGDDPRVGGLRRITSRCPAVVLSGSIRSCSVRYRFQTRCPVQRRLLRTARTRSASASRCRSPRPARPSRRRGRIPTPP